jgi:hypothetical protein
LLPVLTNYPALGRAKKRIEATISEINERLQLLHHKVERFSDAQYRLTGVIAAIFETIDEEELRLLKAVAPV